MYRVRTLPDPQHSRHTNGLGLPQLSLHSPHRLEVYPNEQLLLLFPGQASGFLHLHTTSSEISRQCFGTQSLWASKNHDTSIHGSFCALFAVRSPARSDRVYSLPFASAAQPNVQPHYESRVLPNVTSMCCCIQIRAKTPCASPVDLDGVG